MKFRVGDTIRVKPMEDINTLYWGYTAKILDIENIGYYKGVYVIGIRGVRVWLDFDWIERVSCYKKVSDL